MKKRYKRNSKDVIIGGVAGGLANYFNVDPVFIRLAWVILLFVSFGLMLLVYIIMWIVAPVDPKN
ncbi:PspC domain-containing protein [archaeon]|nr:PspC domain-containing protein [archaeon]NCP79291.1 PspC domain-containing protein [archaeon]NCP98250.1 PspC domain-containing protein [archaeon]NCQ07058.1 PspC domain-containing protein [archaeon]NCQ50854.1 PspC domain-containing protein [archaeon]